jgi:hypothetical protein
MCLYHPKTCGENHRARRIEEADCELKDTIAQESSVIASRSNFVEGWNSIIERVLVAMKAEQYYLKSLNTELQVSVIRQQFPLAINLDLNP